VDGSSTAIDELYGNGNDPSPLGSAFFLSELGPAQIPALQGLESRFQALTGSGSAPGLRLGATTGRFSAEEQAAFLRLSYGVFGRLTVGATLPFIRRRVDSLLRLVPDGANVGSNPAFTAPTEVGTFLAASAATLLALEAAVDLRCTELGEAHADCVSGRSLVLETDTFLDSVDSAYDEELLFPLAGSSLGDAVASRWSAIRTGLAAWETDSPEMVPLATDPLDQAMFRTLVLDPAWPDEAFPIENTPTYMAIGDVELNAALSLLRPSPAALEGREIGIRATLTGGVRFPTGQPDSLRAVAPLSPPRGVSGFSMGVATDLLLSSHFAVLAHAEGVWNGTREMELLAPDPSRLYSPGFTRVNVEWEPGDQLSFGVTPRFHFGPPLSIGAGWQYVRVEADRFVSLESGGPAVPAPEGPFTVQRILVEIRYTATAGALADAVRFPFEAYGRASRTVSGSGEWAPVERKVEAGLRFLLRR
jgi:hypothetical protein